MKNKAVKIIIPSVVFVTIFLLHLVYFKLTEEGCGNTPWVQKYINEQEYFLGISYALSFAFMAAAFLKFKEKRKKALKAAAGSGFLAVALWLSCFFFGCCGSPMLIVYLNLIGISSLKVPKAVLLLMTVIFVGIGYIWLIKKSPQDCCNGKPCKREDAEREKGKIVYFKCKECGLLYKEKIWAERCQQWCSENKSCNLEITKHSVKNEKI